MKAGKNAEEVAAIAPFKVFEGNRPTNSILVKQITPRTLGNFLHVEHAHRDVGLAAERVDAGLREPEGLAGVLAAALTVLSALQLQFGDLAN